MRPLDETRNDGEQYNKTNTLFALSSIHFSQFYPVHSREQKCTKCVRVLGEIKTYVLIVNHRIPLFFHSRPTHNRTPASESTANPSPSFATCNQTTPPTFPFNQSFHALIRQLPLCQAQNIPRLPSHIQEINNFIQSPRSRRC